MTHLEARLKWMEERLEVLEHYAHIRVLPNEVRPNVPPLTFEQFCKREGVVPELPFREADAVLEKHRPGRKKADGEHSHQGADKTS